MHSVVILSALCNFLYGQDNVRTLRGVVWEDDTYNALPHKLNYGDISSELLPQTISLKKYVPKVVTQGPFNMAASWATVWYGGTILEAQRCGLENIATDPGPALSPFLNYYNVRTEERDCFGAVSLIDVLESFKENGSPRFEDHNNICATSVSEAIKTKSLENQISGYVRLFNTFDSRDVKVHNVKQALNGYHPVVIAMSTPKSFVNAEDFWTPKEVKVEDTGGHALCVVGYDDKKYGGAFQVVNSWGKSWGNGGFTWIGYNHFAEFVKYGFELFSEGAKPCKGAVVDGFVRFLDGNRKYFESEQVSRNHYRLKNTLPTGTKFQIEVGSDKPEYIYTYAIGPDNTVYYLFPGVANLNLYPVTGKSVGSMYFPGKSRSITLEDPPGKNIFIIIYSKEALDGAAIEKQLQRGNYSDVAEINTLFDDILVPFEEVKWNSKEISFKSNPSEKQVELLIVEINQSEN
ncbi:MAG: DUF4384 domain-containing protein [Cyclobacteriaceae bacterium]|nr:DUF4384 domain-containing protein [Cyclobacteriaceae bacterium]